MKLLIVEDSPSVRRVIRSIVATLADEIYECEDGADAFGEEAHLADEIEPFRS